MLAGFRTLTIAVDFENDQTKRRGGIQQGMLQDRSFRKEPLLQGEDVHPSAF